MAWGEVKLVPIDAPVAGRFGADAPARFRERPAARRTTERGRRPAYNA
jgi:hypothetical protein